MCVTQSWTLLRGVGRPRILHRREVTDGKKTWVLELSPGAGGEESMTQMAELSGVYAVGPVQVAGGNDASVS